MNAMYTVTSFLKSLGALIKVMFTKKSSVLNNIKCLRLNVYKHP